MSNVPQPQSYSQSRDSAGTAGRSATQSRRGTLDESCEFICVSAALRRLLLQAEVAGARLNVASIEGEPGTGKHLLAQTIHRRTGLADLPFHRRDAREWLAMEVDPAELAGTLYLDRVDMLAPGGQGLLLNVLKVLQGADAGPNRFLLLVSSHASLRKLAGQGLFLPDLAFRLTAVRFFIPPLRERREDIAPLVQALVDRICRRYQQPTTVLAQGTLPRLLQHSWPGNVRELGSVLESAILEAGHAVLRPADLCLHHPSDSAAPLPAPATAAVPQDLSLDAVILRHIQLVLDLNRGNKLRAARQLGISRSTLYRILAGESTLTSS